MVNSDDRQSLKDWDHCFLSYSVSIRYQIFSLRTDQLEEFAVMSNYTIYCHCDALVGTAWSNRTVQCDTLVETVAAVSQFLRDAREAKLPGDRKADLETHKSINELPEDKTHAEHQSDNLRRWTSTNPPKAGRSHPQNRSPTPSRIHSVRICVPINLPSDPT